MRALAKQLLPYLARGICAAMLVGAGDALWSVVSTGAYTSLLSVPLAAAMMAPLGLGLGPAVFLLELLLVRRGLVPLVRARVAGDDVTRRWLAALAFAVSALGAALGPVHALYVQAAGTLQDAELAVRLSVFAWAVEIAVWVLLALPLTATTEWVLRAASGKLDARAHARLSALLLHGSLAGLVLALARFCVLDAGLLGPVLLLPYAALLLIASAWLGLSRFGETLGRLGARWSFWALVLAAFGAAGFLTSALRSSTGALAQSVGPARVMDVLATLSDVDRDGQAGLFGGGDCAPLDGTRGPLAFDIPANHIDEDCDGRDALASKGAAASEGLRKPAPALPAELVQRYNVVLIVIDAFRADRLGKRNPSPLTPHLDRLAKESVHFTQAYSQAPSTRISFPSFLTGRWPSSLRFVRKRGFLQLDDGFDTLATWYKRAGYVTDFSTMTWMVRRMPGIFRGYDAVHDNREQDGVVLGPHYTGFSTTARGVELVERASADPSKPFFLTLYYDGPHSPYDDLTEFDAPARSKRPEDMYDAEIHLVDRQVGAFLDYLRMKPTLWAKTVVAVMADHGEEFGEHGGRFHDRTCYVESTHVPLLIRAPGLAPAIAPKRVSLVDVAPTLLALTGTDVRAKLDGQNIVRADPASYAHDTDARSYCTFFLDPTPQATLAQAVRERSYTYVRNFRSNREELFDTRKDPGERRNVAPQQAGVAASLRALVKATPYAAGLRKPPRTPKR